MSKNNCSSNAIVLENIINFWRKNAKTIDFWDDQIIT